jgi:hypothetical protein
MGTSSQGVIKEGIEGDGVVLSSKKDGEGKKTHCE